MNIRLIFILLSLAVFSCKVPYSNKDVFEEKALLPKDEAPHFKNSLEWWYFTGHLQDDAKQKTLGVEYVVFHFNPTNVKGGWMVNMAVSDPENEAFYYDHQFFPKKKREFMDLPLNFNWSKKQFNSSLKGQNGVYQIGANFSSDSISMALNTRAEKEVVLHDGIGYENYGDIAKAGYYSFPRLKTEGKINLNGEEYNVEGNLWYDRQWNCSGVFDRKVAWDWFSIQFEETKSELMLYRLYSLSDSSVIFGGTYTDSTNKSFFLENYQINISETKYWVSPHSDAKYPIEWNIEVEDLNLKTNLKTAFPNQELELVFGPMTKFYYWEGMCNATGTIQGVGVNGNSYVEMTNRFRIKEQKK
ncbi:MAG: putative secreted hydrolase [Vicingaceae bacterium]|jgi:predicted secreted hydrolase